MPSFNNTSIFGFDVIMKTAINPVRRQENDYPGLNGTESLTLGSAGCVTMCQGLHAGSGAAGLTTIQDLFESYYDGNFYTLVDTRGKSWSNVTLDSFEPVERIFQDPSGDWCQRYTARFVHLTPG